jgi:hypothetical protein
VVEGNAMWNCGITAAPHAQVARMRNVTIANNTIYGDSACVFVRWSGASNMVLANNALYCPGGAAVNSSGLTGSGLTISSNYFEGALSGAAADGSRVVSRGTAASAFAGPAQLDFWPPAGSILIGKAELELAPAVDFNERRRVSPFDVGAYDTDGLSANPGWKVGPGFKQSGSGSSNRPAAPTNLKLEYTAVGARIALTSRNPATSVTCTWAQGVASTLPRLTY